MLSLKAGWRRYKKGQKLVVLNRIAKMYERLEKTGFGLFLRWTDGERSEQIHQDIIQYLRNSYRVDRAYNNYRKNNKCEVCDEAERIAFQRYNERLRGTNFPCGREGRTASE